MEPSEEAVETLIGELRTRVLEVIEDSPPDTFHALDIERIQKDDLYLRRFLIHQYYDPEDSFNMVVSCMKWRKEFGVHDITKDSFSSEFFETGAMYPFTHDKEGHQIIMCHIRYHTKDPELFQDKKRFLVYWIEKLDQESNGQQITFLFDMTDTGLSNVDMEFLKFLISLLKFYYPNTLAYLLVYELPWILSAFWKLVKSWLSTRAVDKIKFVSKQTVLDFIDQDQLPPFMGGTSTFEFQFMSDSSDSVYSQDPSEVTPKKKVHFAEEQCIKLEDKSGGVNLSSKYQSNIGDLDMRPQGDCLVPPICKLLTINPADELIFHKSENEKDFNGILRLNSNSFHTVAFKVKTTNPEKYRVRPSSGIIRPGAFSEITVHLQPDYQNSSLSRDKFLIMAMDIEGDGVNNHELADLWRCCPKDKIMEHKLRCATSLPSSYTRDELFCPQVRGNSSGCSCGHTSRREDALLNAMNRLLSEIRFLQKMVLAILILLLIILIVGFLMAKFDIAPFRFQKYSVNHCYSPFGP